MGNLPDPSAASRKAEALKSHPAFIRPEDDPRRRQLNYTLLIATAILLAFLIPSASYFHNWQLKRNASRLLDTAQALENADDLRGAVAVIEQHMQLAGPNFEDLQHIADLLERIAVPTIQDYRKLERVRSQIITFKPTLQQNRIRLAEILSLLGSHDDAVMHAKRLLEVNENDARALRIEGDALVAKRKFSEAVGPYQKILQLSPKNVPAHALLANCYLQMGDAESARKTIDQMAQRNPDSAEAFYRRYLFRLATSKENPAADIERAVDLEPDNVTYLMRSGEQLAADRRFDRAERRFHRVIELSPGNPAYLGPAYLGLGNALFEGGKKDEAIRAWAEGLENVGPTHFQLNLRLAEALLSMNRPEEVPPRIGRLKQRVRAMLAENRQNSNELATVRQVVDWLEARYYLAKKSPAEALPFLIAATSTDIGDPNVTYLAHEALGRVYADQGNWDLAALCFQKAVRYQADSVSGRLALAQALGQTGRYDEALAIFLDLSRGPRPPSVVWPTIARLRFRLEASRDRPRRNWQAFEESLRQCLRHGTDPVEIALLRASSLATEQQYTKAQQSLLAGGIASGFRAWVEIERGMVRRFLIAPLLSLRKGSLDPLQTVWRSRWLPSARLQSWAQLGAAEAELLDAWGKTAAAESLALRLSRAAPASPIIARSAAAVLAAHGKSKEADALLADAIARQPVEEHAALLQQRLSIAKQSKNPALAVTIIGELNKLRPNDIHLLLELADQRIRAGQLAEVQPLVDRLRQLEGDEGTHWRYVQALARLAQPTSPEGSLAEAAELSDEILKRRPGWNWAHVLAADIALRRGQSDRAIDELKKAIQNGDHRLEVHERLIALLVAQGDHAQADQYLSRLRQSMQIAPSVLPLALEVVAGKHQLDDAERLARQAVSERPNDARAHVWLGQVLQQAGRPKEAEASYRQAIQLDAKGIEPKVALLRLLVAQKREQEARDLLARIEKECPADRKRELVLGYAHALTGDVNGAKDQYQKAVERYPDDQVVLRSAADFFLSRGMKEAEGALKKLQAIRPDDPAVRRAMALHLYLRDDAQSWRQALGLLEDQSTPADLRIRASLLEKLGGPDNTLAATRILEELVNKPDQVTPEDRYHLATLYERAGKLDSAISHLMLAVYDKRATPVQIATCVVLLLRAGRWQGETETLLGRLEKMEPKSFRTVSLRVRWLVAAGRQREAIALLRQHLSEIAAHPSYTATLGAAARLMASLGENDEAEKMWREYAKREPSGYRQLALFLRDRGRPDDAARLCLKEASAPDDRRRLAALVALNSFSGQVSPAVQTLIDNALRDETKKNPDAPGLRQLKAERALREGRYSEAVDLYRRSLAEEPKNVVLLNNLALALAKVGRFSEAAAEIQKAIDLAGSNIELLDTQGVILLQQGNLDGAISILYKVAGDTQSTAVHHLHLAVAYSRANRPVESRFSLEKAKEKNIVPERLSESDRQLLGEITGLERKSG